ncbi:MAG: sodium:solute symporter [Verrucomicrobia bacterium]|jgi:SSS family transporter|nr:MAG: sodium:solute symporter [Verrucomicrobiota bacterium]
MSPALILGCVGGYFAFLLLIAWYTSRNAGDSAYFLGNKTSPWYAVAFGLIGDSLSGVTFISVPGKVAADKFSYLQIVFGYVIGYVVIAEILLPLYYKLNLTSIYGYLRQRFGPNSQKIGSVFFLLSRLLGAAARLFLAASVFQLFVFDQWKIPFWLTVSVTIALILLYTYRGGIKTLVWTDTFQSTFLLLGVILSIVAIARSLDLNFSDLISTVKNSEMSQTFFWDWRGTNYFWKQFCAGAFIAIAMTGLDQNMMQKNLSCRSLGAAKKNIYAFTSVMVLVNLLFVSLGVLLFHYAAAKGVAIPSSTDKLFPMLALDHLGDFAAIVFVIGLTAATFSSADSVLTTLTTSFCMDILGTEERKELSEAQRTALRHKVHVGFAVSLWLVIIGFQAINSKAIIDAIFTLASYTYGPLLGLFAFGLFAKAKVNDRLVPVVCVLSPLICYVLQKNSFAWFHGYKIGFELLILNGLLTFIGLWFIRSKPEAVSL